MRIKILLTLFIALSLLFSCKNIKDTEKKKNDQIDYTNRLILDSLIATTDYSNDTIFLGFRIGMTKAEYQEHVQKIQQEGMVLTYLRSNIFSIADDKIDLGEGYTFKTKISMEYSGKVITGNGEYFLEPIFGKNDNLVQLNILPFENWSELLSIDYASWLKKQVKDNSNFLKDDNLKQSLLANKIIMNDNFIRKKGNIIIYENLIITYIDFKALLIMLKEKQIEMLSIKENNKKIKF